jgi:hypothetical protein
MAALLQHPEPPKGGTVSVSLEQRRLPIPSKLPHTEVWQPSGTLFPLTRLVPYICSKIALRDFATFEPRRTGGITWLTKHRPHEATLQLQKPDNQPNRQQGNDP